MKKLILALGVATIAASLHAAAVSWTLTGVTQPETTTTATGYTAYLFLSASTVGTDVTVAKDDVVSAVLAGTFASDYATKAIYSGSTNNGAIVKMTDLVGDYKANDSISLFTVVFDASSVASAENYAISGSDVSVAYTSATGTKSAAFTNFSANNAWQAIPEPTSGLLMLVGGALLALKRKRA